MFKSYSMTQMVASICNAMGVEPPKRADKSIPLVDEFVKNRVSNGNEFQIILIEHAEESYWTGDNKLETFSTRVNFDGDEALVPKHIIKKYRNENKH